MNPKNPKILKRTATGLVLAILAAAICTSIWKREQAASTESIMDRSRVEWSSILFQTRISSRLTMVFYERAIEGDIGLGFVERGMWRKSWIDGGGYLTYGASNKGLHWMFSQPTVNSKLHPVFWGFVMEPDLAKVSIEVKPKESAAVKSYAAAIVPLHEHQRFWFVVLDEALTGHMQVDVIGLSDTNEIMYRYLD